jgi:hypothetical protein
VLAEAGVVDAGGQGLFVILEGMLRHIMGEPMTVDSELSAAVDLNAPGPQGEEGYGYDIQFIIHGERLEVEQIREAIGRMGDSVLVVGDSTTVKVHVHSPDPGTPISYGSTLGSVSRVIVEDMQQQYQEFVLQKAHRPARAAEPLCPISTVVVAPGDGLAQVFISLGASRVVAGGQSMNPSTEELLQAIEEVPGTEVIVLPNNKNVVLTAQQAKSLSAKTVEVICSITVPQGIAALLALNYQSDLAANASIMADAAQTIQTGEITTAVRSVQVDGLSIKEGETIGLVNGQLRLRGDSPGEVVLAALAEMQAQDREIITIYHGESVTPTDAQLLADQVAEAYPGQEVELIDGGQPHYHYIVSAE